MPISEESTLALSQPTHTSRNHDLELETQSEPVVQLLDLIDSRFLMSVNRAFDFTENIAIITSCHGVINDGERSCDSSSIAQPSSVSEDWSLSRSEH